MDGAPRRAVVRGAGGISPRTLGGRPAEANSKVRVFSLWRRAAPMHREFVRDDGICPDSCNDRPAVAIPFGRGASGGAAGVDYAAPEVRDSRGAGSPFGQEPRRG